MYNDIGIKSTSNKDVVMKSLTVANCVVFDSYLQINVSLLFLDINTVTLE